MSYSMQLTKILSLLSIDEAQDYASVEISSLVIDSRKVSKGSLFFAYPGVASDCLLYTSPSPRDGLLSRMPSSA